MMTLTGGSETEIAVASKLLGVTGLQDYVKKEHGRSWSRAYIYFLMKKGRLKSIKMLSTRAFTKEAADESVGNMKRTYRPYS